jgi:quinoprotein glucose dehydrogenase
MRVLMITRTWSCITAALLMFGGAAAAQDWPHYGGDLGGRRFANAAELSVERVSGLRLAWTFRTGDATDGEGYFGRRSRFAATPLLFEDRLYVISGFGRVYALAPDTGSLHWRFDPEIDFSIEYSEMFTARGVASWRGEPGDGPCAARIFIGTLDARLIAVDARDGVRCSGFGDGGEVDLSRGVARYRRGQYGLTSPPLVLGNLVVVGSSIGDNGAVNLEPGFVRGFDARTGALRWTWHPAPQSRRDPSWRAWGRSAGRRAGGANAWSILSADAERNLVFVPTTSPSPDFYGGLRAGDNPGANSVVALDAATGAVVWQFQTVRHDLWDYDNASQPSLVDIRRGDALVPALVLPTKMGHVFVLDRETGEPLFPIEERSVPQTDVPGEEASPTQIFPVLPEPLHPQEAVVWAPTEDHAAFCRSLLAGVRHEGIFTPPSLQGTMLYPGNPGGTNWGGAAIDPERQIAMMVVNRLPTIVQLIPRAEFRRREEQEEGGPLDREFTEQNGAPYGMMRFDLFNPNTRLPCLRGPWSELVAIDLTSGAVLWRRPVGAYPAAEGPFAEARAWGALITGGPMATAGGMVFIASAPDRRFHGINSRTGEEAWFAETPAGVHATPMAYQYGGAWYVAVAAGGAQPGSTTPGDYLVAYRLDAQH